MEDRARKWNEPLVHAIFENDMEKQILKIITLPAPKEDVLIWSTIRYRELFYEECILAGSKG